VALTLAGTNLKLTVLVYNYAAIPGGTLVSTKREAARIYKRIGIETEWVDCPLTAREWARFPDCPVRPRPTDVIVRIVSQTMAERLPHDDNSLGFAQLPEDGRVGIFANVFPSAAEQIAKPNGIRPSAVLASVIAHEIGHLLLGAGSHSLNGIMSAHWRPDELHAIGRGNLVFAPGESDRIRSAVRARLAAVNGDRYGPGHSDRRSQ
jgi:hypothetical protein